MKIKKILLYSLYSIPLLLVAAALAFKIFQPVQVVPRIRLAPGYSMITQDGEIVTNEDMRGKFVLYAFNHTRCPEPCGNINLTMQEIQNRLDEIDLGGIDMKFITISFDPAYDTPNVLKAYADSLEADTHQWLFITEPDQTLLKYTIGGGFKTYYEEKDDGSFAFDPRFVLVDGWGIIRGEYRYRTIAPDADRILRHIGVLSDEVKKSTGTATLAYEAAHYFLCYTP
ncbi:MAG: SCO family protein [Chloroflexota bacterium]